MSYEKKVTNDSYQLIKVIVLSTNCLINSILFSYLKSSHNETLGFFHHHVIEFTKGKKSSSHFPTHNESNEEIKSAYGN